MQALNREPLMKQTASRYTLSFLSALVALGLSPARATNTYELGSIRVEGAPVSAYRAERVGTATFFAAPPEELPASVDVLTSDFIREQSPSDLHNLLFFQPGMSGGGKSLMDRTSGQYSVRGLAGSTPSLGGTLPMPTAMGIFLDPNALERVEVVKGPVGATQGGQTSALGPYGAGGAINLILKQPRPGETFTGVGASAALGDDLQRYRLTGDHNAILTPELTLRLPFSADTAKPFWLPDGHEWRRSIFMSPALLWQPEETLRLGLATTFQHTDAPGYQGVPSFRGKPLPPYDWDSALAGDHDVRDEYTGCSIQGYAEWDISEIWQLHAGAGVAGSWVEYTHVGASPYAGQSGLPRLTSYDLNWADNRSLVYNLHGRATARYQTGPVSQTTVIQADATHSRDHKRSVWTEIPLDADPRPPKAPFTDTSLSRYGIFVQNHAEWGLLRLLAGLRYDLHESNLDNHGDAWSPRVGLTLMPVEYLVLFGNLSRTEAPNFGHMASRTEELTSSWQADQAEAGLRLRLAGTLWLSLAGFRIEQSDTPSLDTSTGFYVTEGERAHHGVEASLSGNLARNWSLHLGYARTHTETPQGARPFDSQPPHTVTLQTMYRFTSGWLEEFALGLGYRYKHGYDGTMRGEYVGPDYFFDDIHVIDLSLDVPFSRFGGSPEWNVQLAVRNLLDRDYFESNRHYYQCFTGEPRTFEIALRGRF